MSVYTKLQNILVELKSINVDEASHNKFAVSNGFVMCDFLPQITRMLNVDGLLSIVAFDRDMATLRIVDMDDGSKATFTALRGTHFYHYVTTRAISTAVGEFYRSVTVVLVEVIQNMVFYGNNDLLNVQQDCIGSDRLYRWADGPLTNVKEHRNSY